MPRCRISVPVPQSNSRYCRGARVYESSRPATHFGRLRGTGCAARGGDDGGFDAFADEQRASPRRVVSTSGSSGIKTLKA